jgi:hypothetical protein
LAHLEQQFIFLFEDFYYLNYHYLKCIKQYKRTHREFIGHVKDLLLYFENILNFKLLKFYVSPDCLTFLDINGLLIVF